MTSGGVVLAGGCLCGAVRPCVHGWESERVVWLNVVDGLPRYERAPPYDL